MPPRYGRPSPNHCRLSANDSAVSARSPTALPAARAAVRCSRYPRCIALLSLALASRVDVAVLLPATRLQRLRAAIGTAHALHTAQSVGELATVLRTRMIDVVVIDPETPGMASVRELSPTLARYPAVPVIAYVPLSAGGVHGTLDLFAVGVHRIAVQGFDDHPAAFRELLDLARADTLATRVLDRLAPALRALPAPLAAAIDAGFHAPRTMRTGADLARVARIPIRTCSRLLARAGLATPRAFVRAMRVVRAYHGLRGGEARVTDVARSVGYATAAALVHDARRATGLRPSVLAQRIAPDDLTVRVVQRLTRRSDPVGGGEPPE